MSQPGDTELFATARFRVRRLDTHDLVALQQLFDANPDYFLIVNGRRPRADEAQSEFTEMPPPALPHGQRWFAGAFDARGALQSVLHFVSDLMAPGVWHIALFFIATPLHGTGAARELYGALETWMAGAGAQWIRLGVVAGNAKAERFWARMGYTQTRVRLGVDTGGKINDMRILVKPLRGEPLARYLQRVARDHPDSPLP
jgi:GNAT superfamily N-acetyltransferase